MNMLTQAALQNGPCPTINRPYKTVRTTIRGRLSACADSLGTLQLQLQSPANPYNRARFVNTWRSGPLRSCPHILEALHQSLALLGEKPSLEQALRLSRRIDRRLTERLTNYSLAMDGCHELLVDHVRFTDDSTRLPGMPPPNAWVVARVDTSAPSTQSLAIGIDSEFPIRETFVLVRRPRIWELWVRMEKMHSGSMPSRHHVWLCSVDLLHEEPSLAAELLLYALLRRNNRDLIVLCECPAGLVPAERLALMEARLSQASGCRVAALA